MSQPRLLGGRYELDGVIGRGGMAEVYRARDLRLDRVVAVKTLRSDLARDPTFQARFRREAQSAASLNHPSVIAVYDTGEDTIGDTSIPYIVMEYVDGSTLRDLLRENRALMPEKALEITDGILRALDYSHRGQIVHRDIKPANVMLTRNHEVKVMDFGIARAMHDAASTMTQTAQVIGTAQYLSPEQARGERVDARSDIYSTGCVLYELLTGQPPFTGDSPVAIAYQHVREEPVPPSQVDPEIPQWADAIVLKAMAKDADHRYQDATEFRQEIQRALHGQPIASTAASTMLMGGQQQYPQGTQVMGAMPPHTQSQRPVGTGYDLPPVQYDDQDLDRRGGGGGKKAALWITLAVLFIGGAALIGVLLSSGDDNKGNTPADVAVPANIVGQTQSAATKAIEAAGLTVGETTEQFSSEVKNGSVISSNPAPGAEVPPKTPVALVISKGRKPPSTVEVPDVKGRSLNDAQQELTSKGFRVITKQESSNSVDQGNVIRTNPSGGEQAKKNSIVTVFYSSGTENVEVPDLSNQSARAACGELKRMRLRCKIEFVAPPPGTTVTPGFVYQQSPPAGSTLAQGETVTIIVAPKEQQQSPSPGISPPDIGGEGG
ncbi:Stk1 family PASTA domain-containing Ser/Thr kinase [Actinomadura rudentiformis]|uniref:non-specific serine/threonine protein kinase n=1 Tax=Actinomadura rudentiformis TaxID=359158 RepID=A0A6H9YFD6_9ACTN|nr:Stk1 family PASTA domain-containing Ser/Thr kinase [Actinomadura rudentiformis]KAB2344740.1 Stk1 family PASTA domain-containing Ser/Thr kinase [Actinomadura rudentiformis]